MSGDWALNAQDYAERLNTIDSLRPPCPTCGGWKHVKDPPGVKPYVVEHACPDCVDGKVSIEQLVATWRRVWKFADEERHQHGGEYGEGWRACIDHLREVRL